MKKWIVLLALAVLLTACIVDDPGVPAPTQNPAADCVPGDTRVEEAEVVDVVDGDTIRVRLADGEVYRLRYIGVDTPEWEEPFYSEATDFNAGLVDGQTVKLVMDVSETDKYGRLLRYVFVGDTFVNYELVRAGYAVSVTFPPDVACIETLLDAEREARDLGLGLWGQ